MEKELFDVLHPYGNLDVLGYYAKVASVLKDFLKDKLIASKTYIPGGIFFLKRGSKDPKLVVEDFSFVDEDFLKIRADHHLKEVRDVLDEKQALIWDYFVPRKLATLFYATNGEGVGKQIDRIFIDIDRKTHSANDSRVVALALVKTIKKDEDFGSKVEIERIVVLWTGNSFHVYILLKKTISQEFYEKYLSYGSSKSKSESFIMKWADVVRGETGINVSAGHEKSSKSIILDSSNTPSGKLARAPFSLHMKDAKHVDGISVPVSFYELEDKGLITRLQKLTPEKVLDNLEGYGKLL